MTESNNVAFRHVIPLGCHPLTANILKDVMFSNKDLPFDTLVITPDQIVEILKDDFVDFLNKDLYIDEGKDNVCGHVKYGAGFFTRKNPITQDGYDYYVKTVENWRELMLSPYPKLFVTMWKEEDTFPKQNIFFSLPQIGKYTTNDWYLFMGIHTTEEDKKPMVDRFKNITIVIYNTKASTDGIRFNKSDEHLQVANLICRTHKLVIDEIEKAMKDLNESIKK
jgi:hypothetical protein